MKKNFLTKKTIIKTTGHTENGSAVSYFSTVEKALDIYEVKSEIKDFEELTLVELRLILAEESPFVNWKDEFKIEIVRKVFNPNNFTKNTIFGSLLPLRY